MVPLCAQKIIGRLSSLKMTSPHKALVRTQTMLRFLYSAQLDVNGSLGSEFAAYRKITSVCLSLFGEVDIGNLNSCYLQVGIQS